MKREPLELPGFTKSDAYSVVPNPAPKPSVSRIATKPNTPVFPLVCMLTEQDGVRTLHVRIAGHTTRIAGTLEWDLVATADAVTRLAQKWDADEFDVNCRNTRMQLRNDAAVRSLLSTVLFDVENEGKGHKHYLRGDEMRREARAARAAKATTTTKTTPPTSVTSVSTTVSSPTPPPRLAPSPYLLDDLTLEDSDGITVAGTRLKFFPRVKSAHMLREARLFTRVHTALMDLQEVTTLEAYRRCLHFQNQFREAWTAFHSALNHRTLKRGDAVQWREDIEQLMAHYARVYEKLGLYIRDIDRDEPRKEGTL